MKRTGILLFVVSFTSVLCSKYSLLGIELPICKLKDPMVNECVITSLRNIVPAISGGNEALGIPVTDPLFIPFMKLSQNDKLISLKVELKNLTQRGLTEMIFRSVAIDPVQKLFQINTTIPNFTSDGFYKTDSRFLFFALTGDADFHAEFNDLDLNYVFNIVQKKEKGKLKTKLDQFKTYFQFRKTHFNINGLFGGNQVLGEFTNRMMNTHGTTIMNAMSGTITKMFSPVFKKIIQRVFKAVTLED